MNHFRELNASSLRSICDGAMLDFADTSEIEPLDQVIGQERAVRAIDFGLNMKSPGYHIFVTGSEGTGKTSIVKDIIGCYAKGLPIPNDWCMVNNFSDEYCPRVFEMPPGKGLPFSKVVTRLIEDIRRDLPKSFEGRSYQDRLSKIRKKFGEQQRLLFEKLELAAEEKQLRIASDETGYHAVPFEEEKPMTPEEFSKLNRNKKAQIEVNILDMQEKIDATIREINRITDQIAEKTQKITEDFTRLLVSGRFKQIRADFSTHTDVREFLDSILNDVVEHIDRFAPPEQPECDEDGNNDTDESFFRRYRINVLVDHHESAGAPVIFESNPTYPNVIGRIEKRSQQGALITDFSMVQPGSLLKANGGFLIMEMEPLLQNPFVWDALKRTLQNQLLAIEEISMDLGYAAATLRPQPIPIDVKVILLGGYELFETLQNYDSKFNKIFNVRADFDSEVSASAEVIAQYARFIARVCRDERLLPFTADAVGRVIEYGKTLVTDQKKLSLRLGSIVSLIKEADYWSKKDNESRVSSQSVQKALNEYRFRYNLYEEKIHESYMDNTILIDVDGSKTGQVNGLAVYQIGEIMFGRPSRITAEIFMGKPGVINIEREARLSGSSHDKGVMILSGYLGRMFARQYPIGVTISITFEQNYGEIDGDSASSAELCAIISSLSEIPIRQGIAVTGSVNQKGDVQAIGGVNEKIEGFFDVCQAKGLTSMQGVIIPQVNVGHLMLRKDIVSAVEDGRFHVYAVSTVAEGIEILTGMPAGTPDDQGNYSTDTVFGKVQHRIRNFFLRYRQYQKEMESSDASLFLAD
jgi:lon-related putative ATP-dependent protease